MSKTLGKFWPYSKAREFVRALKLKTANDYTRWAAGQIQLR